MRLGIWHGDVTDSLPDILVIDREQIADLQLYIELGELTPPSRLFYVVPNAKKHKTAICYAIKYLHAPDATVIENPPDFQMFFEYWDNVVANTEARLREPLLPVGLADFHPTAVEAYTVAKNFADNCRNDALRSCVVFGTYNGLAPTPNWRRLNIIMAEKLGRLCEYLEPKSTLSDGFAEFFQNLETARKEYARLNSSDLSESLSQMSSYALALAEESINRREEVVSVSFSHRAMDYFLQSICVENGLISDSKEGPIFTDEWEKKVGLMSCYLALVSHGYVLRKKKTHESLHRCNNIRNQLISTHSVFGVSAEHARRYYNAIRNLMERISPDKYKGVTASFKVLLLRGVIPLNLLFSDSGDLSTAFVECSSLVDPADCPKC